MSDEINRLRDQLARIQTALYDTRPKQAVGEMVEHAITLAGALEEQPSGAVLIYQWRYYGSGDGWHDCVQSDYERQHRSANAEDKRFRIVYTHPPTGDAAGKDSVDAVRLNAIADESWDLRCFTIPYEDDADIGWRVIQHHMQAPHERVVAEVFNDDPRAAIDAAIASLTKTADGEKQS